MRLYYKHTKNTTRIQQTHICVLETVKHWGFIHDATSYWVRKINTMFVRAINDIGDIQKVPFEMEQLPGPLT